MTLFKQVSLLILLLYVVGTPTSCLEKASQSTVKTEPREDTVADFRFRRFPKDSVPNPVGYVNDFENIFSSQQEQALDSLISEFEKKQL